MSISCLVLTNCTARKRRGAQALSLGPSLHGKDIQETATLWRAALSGHRPQMPAQLLYVGRAMAEAKRITAKLNGSLWVASAGAGLVAGDELLAPYDLTAAESQGGLQSVLQLHNTTSDNWWNALCGGHAISNLLRDHPTSLLLVALPASYVEMISSDLAHCPESSLKRVRLFTSRAGAALLPDQLAHVAMPYDERLETVTTYKGTRSDFPQRALRHFVEVLQGYTLDLATARTAVDEFLKTSSWPEFIVRRRADDEEIKQIIRLQWRRTAGRCSVLLRYVRDDALVACEQGRFSQLWRSVRDEVGAS